MADGRNKLADKAWEGKEELNSMTRAEYYREATMMKKISTRMAILTTMPLVWMCLQIRMTLISLPTLYGVDNLVICGKSLGMLLASEIFFISKVKYIYIRASLNFHTQIFVWLPSRELFSYLEWKAYGSGFHMIIFQHIIRVLTELNVCWPHTIVYGTSLQFYAHKLSTNFNTSIMII